MIGSSVIVGVDGSAEACDAALLGRRLADAAHGSLHLVAAATNVILDVFATRAGANTERLHRGLLDDAKSRATDALRGSFTPDELSRVLVTRLGRPEHVLAQFGQEVGADVFVLGGRRHEAPMSWIQRGTAHHLLRVGEQTIIVTGPHGSRVDRVLVALDFSDATEPTVQAASELARVLGAPLQAIHVVSHPTLPRELDLGLDTEAVVGIHEREARRTLRGVLNESIPLETPHGDVVPTLWRSVEGGTPTLLVVGAQGRGRVHRLLLGSVTEALLASLPCSLAIVAMEPRPSSPAGWEP